MSTQGVPNTLKFDNKIQGVPNIHRIVKTIQGVPNTLKFDDNIQSVPNIHKIVNTIRGVPNILNVVNIISSLKGVFAKNERGYRLTAIKSAFDRY